MDGVHLLRKRQHMRLWYRALPAPAQPATTRPSPTSGSDLLAHVASAAEAVAWADLLAAPESVTEIVPAPPVALPPVLAPTAPLESFRQTGRLSQPEPVAKPTTDLVATPRTDDADEWRTVPASAPSLLLSATDLLDGRNPGPVLRPGARYRIAGVQNGVVALDVTEPDGQSGLGFCAAVDLICIDARLHRHKAGRTPNASNHPFRARMQRLTGGLSQATASLLGAASHGSR